MDFPFIFGKVVSGSQFIDRKKETAHLGRNVEHGVHTILISPRRWGKSSLVKHVSEKFSKKDQVKFVFIDLFRLSDELEFYEQYSRLVLKSSSTKFSEIGNYLKKFLKSIQPSISIGDFSLGEFNLSMKWEDIEKNYDEILDLPEKIGKKRKMKFVICIDEFQNMEKFKDPELFQSRLRSVWQHHSNVVYVLYGSKRHMMDQIFNRPNTPFFRFGEIMYLQKMKKKHFRKYIISTFEKSGKNITKERVNQIIDIADNNPYFIQQLARNVWIRSSEMVIDQDVDDAANEILLQNGLWYQHEIEKMTTPQSNYLKAVANREKNLSGKAVIEQYKLGTSANVAKIRKVMEEREIIDYLNPYPAFNDPFFRLWISKKFA